jgi:hypothetical protein
MRKILVGVLCWPGVGCFVITASEVNEHDNLGGDWSGEYTLPDGATGDLHLQLEDEAGRFAGEGSLYYGDTLHTGELRGWRSHEEVYIAFHGEEPRWFDVRLQGTFGLGWIEGDCELVAFEENHLWGDFWVERSQDR